MTVTVGTLAILCILALILVVLIPMPTFSKFPVGAVRHTHYAGSWYDSDAAKLSSQIKEYLTQAKTQLPATQPAPLPVAQDNLLAVIAPHAGYMFSGKTAAFSYQAATTQHISRVFILGPSHHVAMHGLALPSATTFETPLGSLEVDQQAVSDLESYPLFCVEPEVHRIEHSVELQLPFIRQTFGDVKIVPIVVGTLADETEIRLAAEVLKGYITTGDIVVVSSDFTHYGPRYGYTPFHSNMQENVEKLDKEAFSHLANGDLQGFLDFHARTKDTICGLFPCAVLCAMLPPEARGHLLKYATSQDTHIEDADNSVSYLAISFTGPAWPEHSAQPVDAEHAIKLSEADRKTLVTIARRSVECWVKTGKPYDPRHDADITISPVMKKCYGAFVTLYSKAPENPEHRAIHSDKQLRGCIGSIWPIRPLYATIAENAVASSSRDYRFHPLHADELTTIEVEISVLTPPRRVGSYKQITLGRDGIILSKADRQAVFLPSVPTEFGWDLPETLRQLCVKAGLRDNDWQDGAKYDLFQSLSIEEPK